MLQKEFVIMKRNGCWTLYRVSYYYKNKLCWYYELHKRNPMTKTKDVLKFGERNFDILKTLIKEIQTDDVALPNIKVLNSEKVLIDKV